MSVGKTRKTPVRAAHLGPERRRPQVLDAALALVAERGIQAVNMEAVAQAVGVTKPAVYACFGSREELLNALLEREEQRLFAAVLGALPKTLALANPERFMAEGFRALFTVVDQHEDSWKLVLASETDPAVAERHREARALVARRVALLGGGWLRLRGASDIKRRLPVLVDLFMSICEGMVRSRIVNGDRGWSAEDLGAYVGRLALAAFNKG